MTDLYYSSERNVQILISLLKAHGIKRVVASPGATNITFVASIQNDSFFDVYSCVDERSAAYIACGMANESGEPVVLTCTGATASRNYIPALTEAFYRKIPVLAVTSTINITKVGNLVPQVIDRSQPLKDIVRYSTQISEIDSKDKEDDAILKLNRAILELKHRGGGPVHINLTTAFSRDFSVTKLPPVREIKRIIKGNSFPEIEPSKKVAVFIGAHTHFSIGQIEAIDSFCESHNSVVFCDHTSGYYGRFKSSFALVNSQDFYFSHLNEVDILIHIGEVSGDYPGMKLRPKEVWRVNEDGELRDYFHCLRYVFEMEEEFFFNSYSSGFKNNDCSFLKECLLEIESVRKGIPDLPFSNVWIAQNTSYRIPDNSVLHLGILNSLRSWNLFDLPNSVQVISNTGGFGIDGGLSSLVGASFVNPQILHFMVIGDLAFFYDMNILGNRHIGRNVRILLINNGKGSEFKIYSNPGYQFGDDTDKYIAAANHFGDKSPKLVRHLAEDLGFEYLTANDKDSYLDNLPRFVDGEMHDRPMLFEVFTDSEQESQALYGICHIVHSDLMDNRTKTDAIKDRIKQVVGENRIHALKTIITGGK